MKILVVAGYCLRVNSSANLCHLSYINGLLDNGHEVDLVTVSEKNQRIDPDIQIPKVHKCFAYDSSLYEQLSVKRSGAIHTVNPVPASHTQQDTAPSEGKRSLKTTLKNKFRSLYGPHRLSIVWYYHAKSFRSEECYDLVISLSDPPVSHKLVAWLMKKKRVNAKHWIQIWEDPWGADICYRAKLTPMEKEEARLLASAERVLYVSPLTMMNQKKAYPDYADKMDWMPLPAYYQTELANMDFTKLTFGYFGDYASHVRNLKPFYNAAVEMELYGSICGNSDLGLCSTDTIQVYPRMPLAELKVHEDAANILVFLCNLKGGQIPGKIYQYSATNKLILFILDGTPEEQETLRAYFSQFNRFIFCDNTKEAIISAIQQLMGNDICPDLYRPLDRFAPRKITQEIIEVATK